MDLDFDPFHNSLEDNYFRVQFGMWSKSKSIKSWVTTLEEYISLGTK